MNTSALGGLTKNRFVRFLCRAQIFFLLWELSFGSIALAETTKPQTTPAPQATEGWPPDEPSSPYVTNGTSQDGGVEVPSATAEDLEKAKAEFLADDNRPRIPKDYTHFTQWPSDSDQVLVVEYKGKVQAPVRFEKNFNHLSETDSFRVRDPEEIQPKIVPWGKSRNALALEYTNKSSKYNGTAVVQPAGPNNFEAGLDADDYFIFVPDTEGRIFIMNRWEAQDTFGRHRIGIYHLDTFLKEPTKSYYLKICKGPLSLRGLQLAENIKDESSFRRGDLLVVERGTHGEPDKVVEHYDRLSLVERYFGEEANLGIRAAEFHPGGENIIGQRYSELAEIRRRLPNIPETSLARLQQLLSSATGVSTARLLEAISIQVDDAEGTSHMTFGQAMELRELRLSERTRNILIDVFGMDLPAREAYFASAENQQSYIHALVEYREQIKRYLKFNSADPNADHLRQIAALLGRVEYYASERGAHKQTKRLEKAFRRMTEFEPMRMVVQAIIESRNESGILDGQSLIPPGYSQWYEQNIRSTWVGRSIRATANWLRKTPQLMILAGFGYLSYATAVDHFNIHNAFVDWTRHHIFPSIIWSTVHRPAWWYGWTSAVLMYYALPLGLQVTSWAMRHRRDAAYLFTKSGLVILGEWLSYPFVVGAMKLLGQQNTTEAFNRGIPPTRPGVLHIPRYLDPTAPARAREKLVPEIQAQDFRRARTRDLALQAVLQSLPEAQGIEVPENFGEAYKLLISEMKQKNEEVKARVQAIIDEALKSGDPKTIVEARAKVRKIETAETIRIADQTMQTKMIAEIVAVELDTYAREHQMNFSGSAMSEPEKAQLKKVANQIVADLNAMPVTRRDAFRSEEQRTNKQHARQVRRIRRRWTQARMTNYARYHTWNLLNYPLDVRNKAKSLRMLRATTEYSLDEYLADMPMVLWLNFFNGGAWESMLAFGHAVPAQADPMQPTRLIAQGDHALEWHLSPIGSFQVIRNVWEYWTTGAVFNFTELGMAPTVPPLYADWKEVIPEHEREEPALKTLRGFVRSATNWRQNGIDIWLKAKAGNYTEYLGPVFIQQLLLSHFLAHQSWPVAFMVALGFNGAATLCYRLWSWGINGRGWSHLSSVLSRNYKEMVSFRKKYDTAMEAMNFAKSAEDREAAFTQVRIMAAEIPGKYAENGNEFPFESRFEGRTYDSYTLDEVLQLQKCLHEHPYAYAGVNSNIRKAVILTYPSILSTLLGTPFNIYVAEHHPEHWFQNWYVMGPIWALAGWAALPLYAKGIRAADKLLKTTSIPVWPFNGRTYDERKFDREAKRAATEVVRNPTPFFSGQIAKLSQLRQTEVASVKRGGAPEPVRQEALKKIDETFSVAEQKLRTHYERLMDIKRMRENCRSGILGIMRRRPPRPSL